MESQKYKLWEVSVDKDPRIAFLPDVLLFSGIKLHTQKAISSSPVGSGGEGSGLGSATSNCTYIQEACDFPAPYAWKFILRFADTIWHFFL